MEPTIRPSLLADLETHVAHRFAMFRDMGMGDDAGRERMGTAFRERLRTWMIQGVARGWIAEAEGQAAAGALVFLKESLPVPHLETCVRAYLANVFVDPHWRGKGLARRLSETALDFCRGQGIPVMELHASLQAEPLYRSMGFVPTSEFRMVLDPSVEVPRQWKDRR
jgi:GNAT superfamily N-acetyltransferase